MIFLWGAIPARGGDEVLSVDLDKEEALLGDSVGLTLTIQGNPSNAQRPLLPEIPDFETQYVGTSMESYSSFTMIIQGKKMEEKKSGGGIQFHYALTPKKTGVLVIPQFSFTFDGKNYETPRAYTIRVAETLENENREDIFLKTTVDKNNLYLGESALFTFEWYFRKNIQDYSLTIPWLGSLKDFLVEDVKPEQGKQTVDIRVNGKDRVTATKKSALYNGKRYTVLTFQKIMTPISAGDYTLEGSFLKAVLLGGFEELPQGNHSRFFNEYFDFDWDEFFAGKRRAVPESAFSRAEPIPITAKPLPQNGRPANFSGAVGSFDFQVDVNPKSVQRGEPVTLTGKVVGSGNFNELQFPEFPEIPDFKGYAPETKTDTSIADGLVIGKKSFEKVLVGRREGTFGIPPITFSYFDPTVGEYKTIARGPFQVEVKPGAAPEEPVSPTAVSNPEERHGKEIKVITQDIRYIKTEIGAWSHPEVPFYQKKFFWIFGFLPLPFLSAIFFLIEKQRRRFRTDLDYARRVQASKKAREGLEQCERTLEGGDGGAFYAAASRSLTGFLADKLGLSPSSVTSGLDDAFKERKIDEKLLADLRSTLERLEIAKFSGSRSDLVERKEMYGRVKALVNQLEKLLR